LSTTSTTTTIASEAPLPRTGSSSGAAYVATAFTVAGIGLVGTVRRRFA